MSLLRTMRAIRQLEEQIELPEDVASELGLTERTVRRAYLIAPASNEVPEMPCFMNWPDTGEEYRLGPTREDRLTVQIDFLCYGPNVDLAAEIAVAFFDATWKAFDQERAYDRRLKNTVSYLTLRGERPMLESIAWGGRAYFGFHVFLDLVLLEETE